MVDRPVKGGRSKSSRRAYHSPERKRRADQTRSRILDAARSLFLSRGYFPTTIRAIAAHAGVAEQTVYLQFKNKPALLDAVIDAAIGGAAEGVPLAQRREAVLSSPPAEMLLRFGEVNAGVMARTARVLAMAEAAASIDPELAEVRERGHAAMRAQFARIANALHAAGGLATDVDEQEAAATIYALANDSVYLRLIDGCGWSPDDYGRWLGRVLAAALGAK
jgi:TetR/AcrR family transcriptional regulator, regulator of autoinduction and epiphytic fitness